MEKCSGMEGGGTPRLCCSRDIFYEHFDFVQQYV